jgi:2-polyprenyl-6-hydroxyphenyl methylase/3-demethylubiquinone-9 3-methyltransferase
MSSSIAQHRLEAAELSGGTSGDPIYSLIERVISQRNLGGRVLDYGAGIGQLTRRLLNMNRFATVAAADIMPVPPDLSARVDWIQQDLNLGLSRQDGAFDVVISAEVIEHLENPRFLAREVFRLLRPGGSAIITTPNNESWRSLIALLVRGHYVAFGDSNYPAHIMALLRRDLTRILIEAGFSAPKFYFTEHGGLPGKPTITWRQISFGLFRGVRFSDNLLALAVKNGRS